LTAGTFTIVNHFAGDPIETLVDAKGRSMVIATGLLGADLPGIISGTSGDDFMDGRGGDDSQTSAMAATTICSAARETTDSTAARATMCSMVGRATTS
jgi:hypothetical protein